MAKSILWYDLETFGLDPAWDRVAQFACVRTDEDLKPTGEKKLLYCKPTADYLPSPYSCLVHGITPRHAQEEGVSDYEFAKALRALMSRPGTTTAGYNSVQFDDEFVRSLFYRNFYDPYEREYRNGNSRWDVIDLMRAAHDLRPEGIVWPKGEDGKPIFTLGALAKANGVTHAAAHDALSDVMATIELARLLRARQPKLYAWYHGHRGRESLRPLIDLDTRAPLAHTAGAYTSERGCTTLVAPVAIDPENRNQLIAIDLRFDPEPIADLPVEELRRRVFSKTAELEVERVPLSRIRLNRCPYLAPASALSEEAAARLGIDERACAEHLETIKRTSGLLQKLVAVFEMPGPKIAESDPDLRIYDGFFPDSDRELFARIHEELAAKPPAEAKQALYSLHFEDERAAQMLRRFFARNFPETLGEAEKARWRDFCAGRLQLPPAGMGTDLATFSKVIAQKLENPDTPARERGILHALIAYREELVREVMEYRGP